jgi:hypothetical protein
VEDWRQAARVPVLPEAARRRLSSSTFIGKGQAGDIAERGEV